LAREYYSGKECRKCDEKKRSIADRKRLLESFTPFEWSLKSLTENPLNKSKYIANAQQEFPESHMNYLQTIFLYKRAALTSYLVQEGRPLI